MEQPIQNTPNTQIAELQRHVRQLENEVRALRSYSRGGSNLQSPNFLKRAFAVWGHHFIAQFIISIIFGIIGFCISLVFGTSLLAIVQSLINAQ